MARPFGFIRDILGFQIFQIVRGRESEGIEVFVVFLQLVDWRDAQYFEAPVSCDDVAVLVHDGRAGLDFYGRPQPFRLQPVRQLLQSVLVVGGAAAGAVLQFIYSVLRVVHCADMRRVKCRRRSDHVIAGDFLVAKVKEVVKNLPRTGHAFATIYPLFRI